MLMISDFISFLEEKLAGSLPGSTAHKRMLPPGRELSADERNAPFVKQSGVLILLFPSNGQLHTCLIKRPASMKHHPGQIGFPGGKTEPFDKTPQDTAIRETQEEVGIEEENYQVIGKLSELYIQVSNFIIHPYVAYANERPTLSVNQSEVESVLFFPVEQFIQKENISTKTVQTNIGLLTVPGFLFGEEFIWGATAMLLSELFEISRPFFLPESHSYSAYKWS